MSNGFDWGLLGEKIGGGIKQARRKKRWSPEGYEKMYEPEKYAERIKKKPGEELWGSQVGKMWGGLADIMARRQQEEEEGYPEKYKKYKRLKNRGYPILGQQSSRGLLY